MKIVSWNCGLSTRSNFTPDKQRALLEECLDTKSADIFVIQECTKSDFDGFKSNWRHKSWYGDDYEYSDRGVAVFSNTCKIEFTGAFNRNFRYVVPYHVIHEETEFAFTLFAVWAKPILACYDDNVFMAAIAPEYKDLIAKGAVIIGDFNTGSNDSNPEHKQRYANLCTKLSGLFDCANETERRKNTFHSGQVEVRDDFCFVSADLRNKANQTVYDDWWKNER